MNQQMLAWCESGLEIQTNTHYHSAHSGRQVHRPAGRVQTNFFNTSIYMKAIVPVLLLLGFALAQNSLAAGDAEQGAIIGYGCLGCHGIEGYNNVYPTFHVPRLGGQKPGYIESALRAYRNGDRAHPTMRAQSGSLSDEDIANVAAWLARFGAAKDTATAESVTGIDAARSCVTCHGEAGAEGAPPSPVLSGQHQDYLQHALMQYRDGARSGTVMSAFVAGLSEDDVEAVTRYYASQRGVFTPASKE